METPQADNLLDLKFPADLHELGRVRSAVQTCALSLGYTDEQASHICLAVDEALVNVIEHGYGGPTADPIEVSIRPTECERVKAILIRIRDYGRCVEPSTIRGRDLDDVRPGGLGVHIIRSIMDNVCFTQAQDRGMILEMVKLLPGSSSESGPEKK